ncbi:hypothetical protein MKW94_002308 [Papaver nudicaule]|uniref:Uncharacterized protein n=1 Tax=Papaver nudicaule TaxID=74823 RepID=A0AA41VB74_PAPNU|nr:hypothetical protein [Papaver nudicaule]
MPHLKQLSLIALIFSFIFVSSIANAGRTTDGVVLQDNPGGPCIWLDGTCNDNQECDSQCDQSSYNQGGTCKIRGGQGPRHCCCRSDY